ncbi:MAG: sulfotransferase domain-containing protein [Alphaproteobacteria bacterium]
MFVCTPPRSGTTWTQTQCCLLLFGWRDIDIKPSDVSPWYEFRVHPLEDVNALLAAQEHRCLIKSHTPLDGIPYNPQSTYVTVYRDPRDVYLSMRHHMDNFQRASISVDLDEDISGPFREWLRTPASRDGNMFLSLENIINHFQSYKRFKHLANIQMFHYSDMKSDLPAAISDLARFLAIHVTPDDIAQMSRIADFQNMRDNAAQFTPHADDGLYKSDENFFNKGVGGQWREVLNAEDLALYDERMSVQLPKEDIAWLHHGADQ